MSSKMIKSLRKMTGSATSSGGGNIGSGNNKMALYLEDGDFGELAHAIVADNTSPTATDHMNLPALRLGAHTDLHQAVLSHDWDGLRSRMGFDDDCLSNPSSQGENLGDAPNKGGATSSAQGKGLRSRKSRRGATNDASTTIKKQHCLARDEGGRTPLHLILLRYTGGSLNKRTLRLRRAPDDVILGLVNADPRACGVPDGESMLPLHVAAREGHGLGVVNAILESFPGSAAERDANGKFSLDYALEYACQNAKKKKKQPQSSESSLTTNGEEEEDSRWAVVKCLLLASPEAAVDSLGATTPSQQQDGKTTSLLLGALSKQAPASVIRMLIPTAAPYFSSRYGVNDASTALYLAIANRYSLDLMKELVAVCPGQTRSVRDETGMGLLAATYVVWAYGEGSKGEGLDSGNEVSDNGSTLIHWTKLKDHDEMMRSLAKILGKAATADGALSPIPSKDPARNDDSSLLPTGFHEWWSKVKYWIMYYRPETNSPGAALPGSAVDAFPDNLLAAALRNPDTPPPIVHIILRLEPSLASSASAVNDRLPLHIVAATSCYTARHYEENPVPYSSTEMVYSGHPAAIRMRDPVTQRLPLHLAIWNGQKTWGEGVGVLAKAEPRALKVKDWSSTPGNEGQSNGDTGEQAPIGLYPFQMAAVARAPKDSMKTIFAYQARNKHTNSQWRNMSVRQKAAEVLKIESEHELNVLTTVFELLRSAPDVMRSSKDEGGTVVKLLAMKWGARGAARPSRTRLASKEIPVSAGKHTTSVEDNATSLFSPSAMRNKITSTQDDVTVEEDNNPFGSPSSLFTDFTGDSFGFNASTPALQFVVEAGKGIVTEMPQSALDVSASMQEEHGKLSLFASATNNIGDTPISPSTMDGASPTGTALLSPDWIGTTALLSPDSAASQGQSTTSASSSDPIPQGFKDTHLALLHEKAASGGKKKSWFKVRSFNKGRRSHPNDPGDSMNMLTSTYPVSALDGAVGQMKNGVPKHLNTDTAADDQDDYWCISEPSFSPSRRLPVIMNDTDAELMILASARMHQNAIYHNWMKAYNVDQSDEEQLKVAPDPSQETMPNRLRFETLETLDTAGTKDTRTRTDMLCSACTSNKKQMLVLPCRHLCLCSSCAKGNRTGGYCPVCQKGIFSTVEVYF
mmetsp:Transcript_8342/g.18017  ORF Transcript_8342/g.18017 Transcript_8342/m.18017 type:complete len:1143 (+) Transcript_8342:184-3612(+)